ncbi:Acetyltransferase [Ananas comosus]|uniref:Acetyltransferase n=2 Tax=Ananas comosus TaxID=4615 RepID=A0A199USH3_ANACO|nr:Acetyltransferase [Ananas comosus]
MSEATTEGGGGGAAAAAAPPAILWNEAEGRFETEDKEAFLQYRLRDVAVGAGDEDEKKKTAMEMVHTFVPRRKRGLGLAAHLAAAAFAHAQRRSLLVIPTCSYISDTYLPRNPAWDSLVYKEGSKSCM